MRDHLRPIPARATFDRLADDWDAAHGPNSPRAPQVADRIAYLRAFCMRRRPTRVLEIGCGTGQNLLGIADLVACGIGVDVSSAMVARAVRNAAASPSARLRFLVDDALTLTREAVGPFDAVLFIGSLEHIEPQAAALRVAADLLVPRGRIVIVMPHPWRHRMLLNPRLRVDGRAIATRMLTPQQLERVAATACLSMVGLAGLSCVRRPWLALPSGRLGSLCAVMGRAYAAELHDDGRRRSPSC